MDAYDVIIMPWLTEKSMEARSMEQRRASFQAILELIPRRAPGRA